MQIGNLDLVESMGNCWKNQSLSFLSTCLIIEINIEINQYLIIEVTRIERRKACDF